MSTAPLESEAVDKLSDESKDDFITTIFGDVGEVFTGVPALFMAYLAQTNLFLARQIFIVRFSPESSIMVVFM